MADVSISQEQYDEWQAVVEKNRHAEAMKKAKREATRIVVDNHMDEFHQVYSVVLAKLLG